MAVSPRIVISYRRDDSPAYAGRLFDELSARFGVSQVFMEVGTPEPGADFIQWIEESVGSADVLIAVIGRSWTSALDESGHRRLDDPEVCLLAQLNAAYIRGSSGDRPVVLLLGCETAVTDFGLQTFVSKFQDLGAALVVGTIASVLGQRAAPVARTIATELAAASKRRRPIATGELLLAIRRKLLAKGELTALCLTAFGDADWQVEGG